MTAPLDHDEFARWREQSAAAAETGELARAGGRYDWACFLYEQAAQLAVKGLLHGAGLDACGHDLLALTTRAAEHVGRGWRADDNGVARLSRHYIATRYPDAHAGGAPASHYTAADAEQAASDAGEIVAAVERAWAELGGAP